MFAASVPAYVQGLTALSNIMTKAEAYATARKIAPETLLTARLYPDMLPFTRQVQIATDHARRGIARIAGKEPLSMEDTEKSFAELQDRIAGTIAHLKTFTAADLDGAATREVTFKAGQREMTMSGQDYLSRYSLPNFYFHMTTAYNILRHNGLEIGKGDFMGA